MGALLRESVAVLVYASGVPWLVRNVWARNKATILVYHDPKPEFFEQHMEYIAARYSFITLDRLVDALHSGDWSQIPPKAVVITIDDGHRGNYSLLPIFRRFGFRPTIYLCSRIVATLRHFWFCDVSYHQALHLQTRPQAERLEKLAELCGHTPQGEYPAETRQALNADEIAEMAPHVDFQAHTCFHPILTAIDDQECRFEIEQSRTDVERITGKPCSHFCFPHGDYTRRELELVRSAGYRSARSMDLGWNTPGTDPYRLKVTGITDDASLRVMIAQLTGIPMWLRRARAGRLDGRHVTLIFEPTRKYQ